MTINEIRTSLPPTPHDDRSVYAWQMALLKSLTRLHSVRQYACLDHDRNILVLDLLSKGDFGFAWKMTYDKSIAPTVGHHAAQVFLIVMLTLSSMSTKSRPSSINLWMRFHALRARSFMSAQRSCSPKALSLSGYGSSY